MKVSNINQIMFKSSVPVTKPTPDVVERKQINELKNITPDYAVIKPQKYSDTGVVELQNGLKLHTYKLANGHKITIIPVEGSSATVKNYVNVGSMNETDDIKGISHFLEHMAFNGTLGTEGYEKLNPGDSFNKIEKLGGWINASTNFAVTDYVNSSPLLEDSDFEIKDKGGYASSSACPPLLCIPRFYSLLQGGDGIILSLHTLCQTIRLEYFPPLCLWQE